MTGVQIHNWANNFEDDSPNLEFVAPTAAYVVVNGVKTHVDLSAVPPLTPRQTKLINGTPDLSVAQGGQGVVMEEAPDSSYDNKDARRATRERLQKYLSILKSDGLEGVASVSTPTWQSTITTDTPARCETDNSTFKDQLFAQGACLWATFCRAESSALLLLLLLLLHPACVASAAPHAVLRCTASLCCRQGAGGAAGQAGGEVPHREELKWSRLSSEAVGPSHLPPSRQSIHPPPTPTLL